MGDINQALLMAQCGCSTILMARDCTIWQRPISNPSWGW